MSLFAYKVIDKSGIAREGTIEAINQNVAISSLQRRGFIISEIREAGKKNIWESNLSWFERVSPKDVVILSRQLSTLFEAQVSALRVFRLLAEWFASGCQFRSPYPTQLKAP